jgi:hypothetical protein
MLTTRLATCSCEQLRVLAEGEPVCVSICHCLACQRRTGSAFGVQARFDVEQIRTEGKYSEYVRISDEGDERIFYFCPDCGGTVFFKVSGSAGNDRRPRRRVRGSGLPRAHKVHLGVATAPVGRTARGDRTRRVKVEAGDRLGITGATKRISSIAAPGAVSANADQARDGANHASGSPEDCRQGGKDDEEEA